RDGPAISSFKRSGGLRARLGAEASPIVPELGGSSMFRHKSFLIVLLLLVAAPVLAQFATMSKHPAIAYETSKPTDPVSRLIERIKAGEVTIEANEKNGYLSSVLEHLDIPVSSQSLVFSKTSLQADKIAPWSPR